MADPKCPYCGEQFSEPTMQYHIIACSENPKNKVFEEPKEKDEEPKKKKK